MEDKLKYIDNELKQISVKDSDVVHMFNARVELANALAEAKTIEASLKELQEKKNKHKEKTK